MEDEQPSSAPEPPQAAPPASLPPVVRDDVLVWLVHLANQGFFQLPLTLSINGLLVSGYLINGRKFHDGIADQFREGLKEFLFDDPDQTNVERLSSTYHAMFTKVGERYDSAPPYNTIAYLHLERPRAGSQPQTALSFGRWFRVRLEEIDGWCIWDGGWAESPGFGLRPKNDVGSKPAENTAKVTPVAAPPSPSVKGRRGRPKKGMPTSG